MFKQFLLNSIITELKLIRRLTSKITEEQLEFRPKEGVRSTHELLQYLSYAGTGIIQYWYRTDESDLKTTFAGFRAHANTIPLNGFVDEITNQIELAERLFEQITEEDLLTKEVDYPGGATGKLGEAIINTSIKWLTAYKLQLFLNMKLSSEEVLATPDLWRKTELVD
jgi:hypothetical protein